jgi:DNA-binding MarR family transcriptional regulator
MTNSPPNLPGAVDVLPTTSWWIPTLTQQLSRTERELRQQIGLVAADHNLSISEALLLLECVRAPHGHNSQRQLAEVLGCSAAQISGQLDALGKRGLLFAQRPAHDRRRQSWRATNRGRRLADAMGRALAAISTPHVTANDIQQLISTLSRLRQLIADAGRQYHGAADDDDRHRQRDRQGRQHRVRVMREKAA